MRFNMREGGAEGARVGHRAPTVASEAAPLGQLCPRLATVTLAPDGLILLP